MGFEYSKNILVTYSGKHIDILNISVEDICIEDIAQALSNLCRFSGHCFKFYSVAEHSLLVSSLVPKKYALDALLHDAAEAYLSDMPSPIKHILPDYKSLELKVNTLIQQKFALSNPLPSHVNTVDKLLVIDELSYLMPHNNFTFNSLGYGIVPNCHPPSKAKHLFLDTFYNFYKPSI